MPLRLLTTNDLPALLRLSASANWNQSGDDWLRVLRLAPNHCLGIEVSGTLAASATVITYGGTLAWIGMVLTLPEFRGRGLARELMLESLARCGDAVVRLDASDMGRPLYESLGFIEECPIERWRREPGEAAGPELQEPLHLPIHRDAEIFGADRSALLAELAKYETARCGDAYAFGRPGRVAAQFGPCISASAADAERLCRWFVLRHQAEPVFVDLFPHHGNATTVARTLGFAPVRRLTRMVLRPGTPSLPDPRIYAAAGFEYG